MRKSKIFFVVSMLCLLGLVLVCFVFSLPYKIKFYINILLVIIGFVSYLIYIFKSNLEFINTCEKRIDELKNEFKEMNNLIVLHTKEMYKRLPSNFTQQFLVKVDTSNSYLLDFESNLKLFHALGYVKNIDDIKNSHINIACVVDSLMSAWCIKTDIPKKMLLVVDLVALNSELAVRVALSLMNLSFDNFKDDIRIKQLIQLLIDLYLRNSYGNTYTILYIAIILEDLSKTSSVQSN